MEQWYSPVLQQAVYLWAADLESEACAMHPSPSLPSKLGKTQPRGPDMSRSLSPEMLWGLQKL